MKVRTVLDTKRQLLPLWDYGWLEYERIAVEPYSNERSLLNAYLASDGFRTSFLGPEHDFTPLVHGPFLISELTADDFQQLDAKEFIEAIYLLRQPPDFLSKVEDEQWSPVENLLKEVWSRNTWIFKLKLTEEDSEGEKAHETGWVHSLFREFLFGNCNSPSIERIVFGYD